MSASDAYTEKEVIMKSGFKPLLVSALLASAGFAAFAQQPSAQDMNRAHPNPMMGMGAPMQQGGPMGMRGKMDPARMEAMMAKRHAEMKAKLKITADQEGAWTSFTAAMKPMAAMDHKRPDRAEMDKLTTPERIDKMRALRAERMTAMNAAMEKREDATKTFYAALNADQKKVFDAEHARMGAHRGGHRAHGPNRAASKPAAQ